MASDNVISSKLSYQDWIKAVDDWCYRLVGCSIHDLPDICLADLYEDGCSPKSAARKAIHYSE